MGKAVQCGVVPLWLWFVPNATNGMAHCHDVSGSTILLSNTNTGFFSKTALYPQVNRPRWDNGCCEITGWKRAVSMSRNTQQMNFLQNSPANIMNFFTYIRLRTHHRPRYRGHQLSQLKLFVRINPAVYSYHMAENIGQQLIMAEETCRTERYQI